jgi:hypothetical protein
MRAKSAALASVLPHMHRSAEGRPTDGVNKPDTVEPGENVRTYQRQRSTSIVLPNTVFVEIVISCELSR